MTPQFHFYPSGHAFFNDENLLGTHDPEQAKLAWSRTVEFLRSTSLTPRVPDASEAAPGLQQGGHTAMGLEQGHLCNAAGHGRAPAPAVDGPAVRCAGRGPGPGSPRPVDGWNASAAAVRRRTRRPPARCPPPRRCSPPAPRSTLPGSRRRAGGDQSGQRDLRQRRRAPPPPRAAPRAAARRRAGSPAGTAFAERPVRRPVVRVVAPRQQPLGERAVGDDDVPGPPRPRQHLRHRAARDQAELHLVAQHDPAIDLRPLPAAQR